MCSLGFAREFTNSTSAMTPLDRLEPEEIVLLFSGDDPYEADQLLRESIDHIPWTVIAQIPRSRIGWSPYMCGRRTVRRARAVLAGRPFRERKLRVVVKEKKSCQESEKAR